MFLEFVDPYRSLELHTGNTTTCEEIMNIIGEYKGASRDPGLREVEMASKSKKRGIVQYDFMAESQDELTIKSGDKVYILDDKQSKDWWMCQLVDSGKSGLVPAQFIEPVRDKNILNLQQAVSSSLSRKTSPNLHLGRDLDQDLNPMPMPVGKMMNYKTMLQVVLPVKGQEKVHCPLTKNSSATKDFLIQKIASMG